MVSPLNTFLTASYASSMVNALFAPLSTQDTGTATTSTAAPSVSSTSSSADKVTSAAIAAIQGCSRRNLGFLHVEHWQCRDAGQFRCGSIG